MKDETVYLILGAFVVMSLICLWPAIKCIRKLMKEEKELNKPQPSQDELWSSAIGTYISFDNYEDGLAAVKQKFEIRKANVSQK